MKKIFTILWIIASGVFAQDPLPELILNDIFVPEGETANIKVRLSSPYHEAINVNFWSSRTSRAKYDDFQRVHHMVTLEPGETEAFFSVDTFPDNWTEINEYFAAFVSYRIDQQSISKSSRIYIVDDDVDRKRNTFRSLTTIGDTPQLGHLTSVAISDHHAVIVGQNGLIFSNHLSVTYWGNTALNRSVPNGPDFTSVKWDGDAFIAFGTSSRYYESPSGNSWTRIDIPHDYFPADGVRSSENTLFLFEDGSTLIRNHASGVWQQSAIPEPDAQWGSVTFTGDTYWAAGESGLASSTDGYTWQRVDGIPLDKIHWNGSELQGTYDNTLYSSNDGINWNLHSDDVSIFDANASHQAILQSDLLAIDSENPIPSSGNAVDLAVGKYDAFVVQENGEITIHRLSSQSQNTTSITRNLRYWGSSGDNGKFVVVGDEGTIIHSSDGFNWTNAEQVPSSERLFDVIWDGSQYVCVGSNGALWTSPDANVWTAETSHTGYWLRSIAYNGSSYLAVGYGGVLLTSPDSINWTRSLTGGNERLLDVSWIEGQWVIVGDDGAYYTANADLTEIEKAPPVLVNDRAVHIRSVYFYASSIHLATSIGVLESDSMGGWTVIEAGDFHDIGELPPGNLLSVGKGYSLFTDPPGLLNSHKTGLVYTFAAKENIVLLAGSNGLFFTYECLEPLNFNLPPNVKADEGLGYVDIPYSIDEAFQQDLTFQYRAWVDWRQAYYSRPNYATEGLDYMDPMGSFTIPAGQQTGVIRFPIFNDEDVERNEYIQLGIYGAATGYGLMNSSTLITIDSDDSPMEPRTAGEDSKPWVESDFQINNPDPVFQGIGEYENIAQMVFGETGIVLTTDYGRKIYFSEDNIHWELVHESTSRFSVYLLGNQFVGVSASTLIRFTDSTNLTIAENTSSGYSLFANGYFFRYVSDSAGIRVERTQDLVSWTHHPYTVDGDVPSHIDYGTFHYSEAFNLFYRNSLVSTNGYDWVTPDEPLFPANTHRRFESHGRVFASNYGRRMSENIMGVWKEFDVELPVFQNTLSMGSDGHTFAFANGTNRIGWLDPSGEWHSQGLDKNVRNIRHDGEKWILTDRNDVHLISETLGSAFRNLRKDSLDFHEVIWTGDTFVIVGECGVVITSGDGHQWEERDSGTDWNLRSVASGNNRLVAVGNGGAPESDGKCLVSFDNGASWSESSIPANPWLHCVQWLGNRFFAGGSHGTILSSPDGIQWQQEQTHTDKRIEDIAISTDGIIIAVGEDNLILRSVDEGGTWNALPPPTDEIGQISTIIWTGTHFLAGGVSGDPNFSYSQDSALYYSQDGLQWNSIETFGGFHLNRFTLAGNSIYSATSSGIAHSNHLGEGWGFHRGVGRNTHLRGIAASDTTIVSVGSFSLIQSKEYFSFPTYENWVNSHGLNHAAAADTNNASGIPNLMAYAFNLNPHQPEFPDVLPRIQIDGQTSHIILREPEWLPPHVGIEIQQSSNLEEWNTIYDYNKSGWQTRDVIGDFRHIPFYGGSRNMFRVKVITK